MNIGDTITTREQLASLPVGTVLTYDTTDWRYTKQGHDAWVDHSTRDTIVDDASFSMNGLNRIVSLPDGTVPTGTVADPELVPVGASVGVAGTTWTRTAEGFQRPDLNITLPTTFFTGAAAQSLIHEAAPMPTVREVRRLGSQFVIPLKVTTTGTGFEVWASVHNPDGVFHRTLTHSFANAENPRPVLGDLVEAPAWVGSSWPLLQALIDERDSRPAPVDTAVLRQRGVRDGRSIMQAEVTEAFTEAWDGVSFTLSEINEVLEGIGCEPIRETEEVTVTVSVSGTYAYELEVSELETFVNDYRSADVSDSQTIDIEFTYEFTVEREVTQGGCACGEVEEGEVYNRLDSDGIRNDSFTYDLSCSNC